MTRQVGPHILDVGEIPRSKACVERFLCLSSGLVVQCWSRFTATQARQNFVRLLDQHQSGPAHGRVRWRRLQHVRPKVRTYDRRTR